jgi:hypothetical protein
MAAAGCRMPLNPITDPMTGRAKKTATMSEKTLTPRKKYTDSVAVTSPPKLEFQAVSKNDFCRSHHQTRGKPTGSVPSVPTSVE